MGNEQATDVNWGALERVDLSSSYLLYLKIVLGTMQIREVLYCSDGPLHLNRKLVFLHPLDVVPAAP